MIVEDDVVQIKLIDQIIKSAGLQTILASNGHEAQETLKTHTPDLFLIDLHMPDITGFQLLKVLRSDKKFEKTPVIMMSIDTSEESAILCISSGASSYINKPIRISELFLKLKKFLNYEVPEKSFMDIYNSLRTKTVDPENHMTSDMINYVLGNESFQEAKSICTFASVMTIKIQGLLPMVHQLGSDKIQRIYDEIISHIFGIIYKNRGAISSVFNDLIFCTFGIPVVYDNDTINALQCANELLNTDINKLNSMPEIKPFGLKLSVSIMSGKVYLGAVRTMQALNDSIMGTPLIRAIRMETLGDESGKHIIIDKETKNLVSDYVKFTTLDMKICDITGQSDELYHVISIDQDKISKIPNILKQYTPKDSVSGEGYQKL
jgi:CheY-like chemotaxis protein